MRYFEMAIEKDAGYGAPYAGLASGYALGYFQGSELQPREAWSKAAGAARKALELDDQLAEAHFAMALIRFRYDWNWPETEREFTRGLELSPNDVVGHRYYASFLATMERPDEALAEATLAKTLDPLSPIARLGMSWVFNLTGAVGWMRRL
jgi:tetratricopeptide (TPR) repeat protein